jgi:hypothetical protein
MRGLIYRHLEFDVKIQLIHCSFKRVRVRVCLRVCVPETAMIIRTFATVPDAITSNTFIKTHITSELETD